MIYHVTGCSLVIASGAALFVLLGASAESMCLERLSHPSLLSRQVNEYGDFHLQNYHNYSAGCVLVEDGTYCCAKKTDRIDHVSNPEQQLWHMHQLKIIEQAKYK